MINAPSSLSASVPPSNIFRKPLSEAPALNQERDKKERVRNHQKAFFYLMVSVVALIAYSFFFLYPQAIRFLKAPDQIQALDREIKNYEEVTLPSLSQTRDLKKAAYDEQLGKVESNIDQIFPSSVDKLGLVKRLENFATAIHTKNPPFEFNAITFGKPVEQQGFNILPVSTSIYSGSANFERVLELISFSGQLSSDLPIRLMEISNISIRYRGVDPRTGKDRGVDFTVKLNAYSRSDS